MVNNDYAGYYNDEIKERESYFYPPFTRVISITVKHEEQEKAEKAAHWLANKLLEKLGKARVLGPEKGMVERVRNKFLFDILLKLEKDKLNIKAAKVFLQEQIDELKAWWKQNGRMISALVIGVLVAYSAYQGWHYFQNKQASTYS